jgi:prepilin-type N-terminal cleavage/methylation domain-containing protein
MTRRGLTLIEVVAATVLLSLLAVAVVPVLRDARAQAEARGPRLDVFELGLLADRLVDDPESMGVAKDWAEQISSARQALQADGTAITVHRERADWIVFERGSTSVARFVPLEEEQP